VGAFTELGPAWVRWVHANLPGDAVSYSRLRVLTILEGCRDGRTMKQLAEALEVTARRVTSLVDALEEDGLLERYAHPTDGRSTVVQITPAGLDAQRLGWQRHQHLVGEAFGDLSDEEQVQLLAISRKLTRAFRARLAAQTVVDPPAPETTIVRRNRRMKVAPVSNHTPE
jgi:DNA-binding MarR family transcriptional regulator